jgi:hypothetical protein
MLLQKLLKLHQIHFFTYTFKQSAKALLACNALIIAQHYVLQHCNGGVGNLGIKAA